MTCSRNTVKSSSKRLTDLAGFSYTASNNLNLPLYGQESHYCFEFSARMIRIHKEPLPLPTCSISFNQKMADRKNVKIEPSQKKVLHLFTGRTNETY